VGLTPLRESLAQTRMLHNALPLTFVIPPLCLYMGGNGAEEALMITCKKGG